MLGALAGFRRLLAEEVVLFAPVTVVHVARERSRVAFLVLFPPFAKLLHTLLFFGEPCIEVNCVLFGHRCKIREFTLPRW